MPVHPLKGGGWQWGRTGKKYRGKNAKKKAIAQGLAAGYNSPGKVAHISHKGPTKLDGLMMGSRWHASQNPQK